MTRIMQRAGGSLLASGRVEAGAEAANVVGRRSRRGCRRDGGARPPGRRVGRAPGCWRRARTFPDRTMAAYSSSAWLSTRPWRFFVEVGGTSRNRSSFLTGTSTDGIAICDESRTLLILRHLRRVAWSCGVRNLHTMVWFPVGDQATQIAIGLPSIQPGNRRIGHAFRKCARRDNRPLRLHGRVTLDRLAAGKELRRAGEWSMRRH